MSISVVLCVYLGWYLTSARVDVFHPLKFLVLGGRGVPPHPGLIPHLQTPLHRSDGVTFVGQLPSLRLCPWLEGRQIRKHKHTHTPASEPASRRTATHGDNGEGGLCLRCRSVCVCVFMFSVKTSRTFEAESADLRRVARCVRRKQRLYRRSAES